MTTQAELVSITDKPRRRWHELARNWADYAIAAMLMIGCGFGYLAAWGVLAVIEWLVG